MGRQETWPECNRGSEGQIGMELDSVQKPRMPEMGHWKCEDVTEEDKMGKTKWLCRACR